MLCLAKLVQVLKTSHTFATPAKNNAHTFTFLLMPAFV